MENHHFLLVNQLNGPFSIAMLVYQRVHLIFSLRQTPRTWLKEGVVGDSMEPASDPLVILLGKVDAFFLGKC
jgi:hypothetical protein